MAPSHIHGLYVCIVSTPEILQKHEIYIFVVIELQNVRDRQGTLSSTDYEQDGDDQFSKSILW